MRIGQSRGLIARAALAGVLIASCTETSTNPPVGPQGPASGTHLTLGAETIHRGDVIAIALRFTNGSAENKAFEFGCGYALWITIVDATGHAVAGD